MTASVFTDLTMLVPVLSPMRLFAFLSVNTLAMPANPMTYSLKSIVPLYRERKKMVVEQRYGVGLGLR